MDDKVKTEVKRLMEFYFGDINLSKDQYSMQLLKSNENKVPLKNINETYPKLMAMKVSVEQIRDALKDSEILTVDDSLNLARKVPFDESRNFNDQAVYVKGLPRGIQLQQISAFFSAFGVTPELISFHRNIKNATKGTFDLFLRTKEEQQKILQAFGNQTKDDERWKQCSELFKNVQIDRQDSNFLIQFQTALLNRLTVIPLEEYLKAEQEEAEKRKTEMTKKESEEVFSYIKGLVLKITNIDKEAGITRKDLQNTFQKYGEIKFIELNDGSDTAYIRFRDSSPDAPVRACQDHEKEPIKFGSKNISLGVLESAEEEEYWAKIIRAGDRKWKNNKQGKRK